MPLKDPIARRAYQLEWERRKYSTHKRAPRVFTPEQRERRRELERKRGPGRWDKSEAAKTYKRGYARQWRASNPDKMGAANRRAYLRNLRVRPGCYVKYSSEWRGKNLEKCRAIGRKFYENNREAILVRCKQWRQANPIKVLEWGHEARARKRNATTEDCSRKICTLKKARFCHWCCVALTPKTVTIDHVIPLARGGKHCNNNLVAACLACNTSRKAKLVTEWTWREAA